MLKVVQRVPRPRSAPARAHPSSPFAARPFADARERGAREPAWPGATRGFAGPSAGASPSTPLPHGLRAEMEARLGHRFADVRVHHDGSPSRLGALATASGSRIHFARGAYRPHTDDGRWLIAHELAHVAQQRAGRVRATSAGGPPVNTDPRLEAEADAVADGSAHGPIRAAAATAPQPSPAVLPPAQGAGAGGPVVQCTSGKKKRKTRSWSALKRKRELAATVSEANIVEGRRERRGVARMGVGDGTSTGIGAYAASEGIPTTDVRRAFTKAVRAKVNRLGKMSGCHTCGTKSPEKFIPDHQPPLATYRKRYGTLSTYKGHLFPHCRKCSSKQGGRLASGR